MVVPAFGFSVGDFIAVGNLIRAICKALKDIPGSVLEYQQLIVELHGLGKTLDVLRNLQPAENDVDHVNTVCLMALTVRISLEDFLGKLRKFEKAMQIPAPASVSLRGSFRIQDKYRKAEWELVFKDEVQKFRAMIMPRVSAINVLLSKQIYDASLRVEKAHKDQKTYLGTRIDALRDDMNSNQESTAGSHVNIEKKLTSVASNIEELQSDTATNFGIMERSATSIDSSLIEIQKIGKQFLRRMRKLPEELKGILQETYQNDMKVYTFNRRGYGQVPYSPSEETMVLVDAAGQSSILPLKWFSDFEYVEVLLKKTFGDHIGKQKVLDKEYHFHDSKDQRQIITPGNWSQSLYPGATMIMSIIMSHLQWQSGKCPRPSCLQPIEYDGEGLVTCSHCKLVFLPPDNGRVQMVDEGVRIAEIQEEEDLRTFGDRPIPFDGTVNTGIDQDSEAKGKDMPSTSLPLSVGPNQLSKQLLMNPPVLAESAYSKAGSSQDVRMTERSETSTQWSPTPLENWLICVQNPPNPADNTSIESKSINPEKNEQTEIELFQNVSLTLEPRPDFEIPRDPSKSKSAKVQGAEDLEFAARIYYRNILDRYPSIPLYLAKRLATRNLARIERLHLSHSGVEQFTIEDPALSDDFKTKVDAVPLINSSIVGPAKSRKTNAWSTVDGENQNEYRDAEMDIPPSNFNSNLPLPQDSQPVSNPFSIDLGEYLISYWTGKCQKRGPHSSNSGSSSKNSSLQDPRNGFMPSDPSTETKRSEVSVDLTKVVLPPPPVELGVRSSFICDICNEEVFILRDKDWRHHVYEDLRPYSCTFENCPNAERTYSKRRTWARHERENHRCKIEYHCPVTYCNKVCRRKPHLLTHLERCHSYVRWQIKELDYQNIRKVKTTKEAASCFFCAMEFTQPNFDIARHVGRHLEEIAFAVTARPYLEWSFPDSSSVDLSSNRSSKDARGILIALRDGDINALKYYMDREYDLVSFKKPAYSLLTKAIRQGNYALVYLLIKSGLRPAHRNEDYNPDIVVDALRAGHLDIVYLLLLNGVKSLELPDAVRYGDERIVKFLTSSESYGLLGYYALFYFAKENDFVPLRKLLKMRTKTNLLDNSAEETEIANLFKRLVHDKRHHKALIMILQYDTPIPMLTVLTCLDSSLEAQPGLETLLNMPSPESRDGKLANAMFQFCCRFSYRYWFQSTSKAHKIRSEGRHKEFLINIAVEEGLQKAEQYLLIRRHDIKKYTLTMPHDANTA